MVGRQLEHMMDKSQAHVQECWLFEGVTGLVHMVGLLSLDRIRHMLAASVLRPWKACLHMLPNTNLCNLTVLLCLAHSRVSTTLWLMYASGCVKHTW